MNNECSQCKHNLICRYVEDYRDFKAQIDAIRDAAKKDENNSSIFTLTVTCPFFLAMAPLLRAPSEGLFDDKPFRYLGINNQQGNPCESCRNKPDVSKGPINGDSMCDWCQHNPFKVTNIS